MGTDIEENTMTAEHCMVREGSAVAFLHVALQKWGTRWGQNKGKNKDVIGIYIAIFAILISLIYTKIVT